MVISDPGDDELDTVLWLLEFLEISAAARAERDPVTRRLELERDPVTRRLELERLSSTPEWTESENRAAWGDR